MDDDVDRHVALMDAAGIDKACINCVFYGDARRSNDYAVRFARERPDRFYFAAFASPHYPEEVARELDRAIDTLGPSSSRYTPTTSPCRWRALYGLRSSIGSTSAGSPS